MSTPNDDTNCASRSQDKEPLTDKHHTVPAAAESQPSDTPVPLQQQPLPSFDVAHQGWDASNVSTAKCDLCHRQRCGTLQKCRVCKLSICHECCVGGRLQNDRRHTIDAAAVDWDVPPNLGKRKRPARESGDELPMGAKRQRASARRGRGRSRGLSTTGESRGGLASSVLPGEAAPTPDSEASWQSVVRFRQYGHADPMEPWLSVAPASYYPSVGRAQLTHVVSPKYAARYELETASPIYSRLPAIEEACDDHGNEEYRASLNREGYPATSTPGLLSRRPVSPANDFSQAAPSRPVLPPISLLFRDRHIQRHHSADNFQTGSDILNHLEHLLHHHQPVTNETWPPHEHVSSLGTNLANAARTSHASSPTPLDQCLRDELQAVWASRAFIDQDADAGRRYRRLLAAAYFASTCLGLSPWGNAAREWLCGEERRLREMGYEPTKTAPLMDFLQEVGIWYMRQAQR